VELAVDPVKLAAYMSSLSQLNALGNNSNGHGAAPPTVPANMDGMDDAVWNSSKQLHGASGFSMEEINEVFESHPTLEHYSRLLIFFFPS